MLYDNEEVITKLVEFLQNNNKLRDIEVYLPKHEHVDLILDAIKKNFMLRTVILKCKGEVKEETINKAKMIENERI